MGLRILFAAVVALPCALPALAAMQYTVTTEVIRETDSETISERVVVDGNNGRIDFLRADGSPSGSFMLTNDGGRTFLISNDDDAVCSQWSTAEFSTIFGHLMEEGRRLTSANLAEAKVEKILHEDGPELLSFPTQHIRLRTSYGAEAKVLFMTFRYDVEETDDLWVTDAIEVPPREQRFVKSATGFTYYDDIYERWIELAPGAILRQENVVLLVDRNSGKRQRKIETTAVTSIEQIASDDIPPERFLAPTCESVSKREMRRQARKILKNHIR